MTTRNKTHQQVNGPVALLKLKIRSFIPVNLLRGTNSLVRVALQSLQSS